MIPDLAWMFLGPIKANWQFIKYYKILNYFSNSFFVQLEDFGFGSGSVIQNYGARFGQSIMDPLDPDPYLDSQHWMPPSHPRLFN
jgi:hypothetical protein